MVNRVINAVKVVSIASARDICRSIIWYSVKPKILFLVVRFLTRVRKSPGSLTTVEIAVLCLLKEARHQLMLF